MEVEVQALRRHLPGGAAATVHVARFPLGRVRLRVMRVDPPAPMPEWADEHGIPDALSGGFAVKPEYLPLGELRTDGIARLYRPFQGAWEARRGALLVEDGRPRIAPRDELPPTPEGDLLQAGPMLARDGRSAVDGESDPEGFSATQDEFDQDLTAGREPRVAIGLTSGAALAVAVEGRSPEDAGMTFWELADLMVDLGAAEALNLDGGSAGALVVGGRLRNTPRDDEGEPCDPSSPATSAIVFAPV